MPTTVKAKLLLFVLAIIVLNASSSMALKRQGAGDESLDACIGYGAAAAGPRIFEIGGWRTVYRISVGPTHAPGCPRSPAFVYTEPDGTVSGPYYAPFVVWTIGAPATGIHVIP
jgi:hypothetical protein